MDPSTIVWTPEMRRTPLRDSWRALLALEYHYRRALIFAITRKDTL